MLNKEVEKSSLWIVSKLSGPTRVVPSIECTTEQSFVCFLFAGTLPIEVKTVRISLSVAFLLTTAVVPFCACMEKKRSPAIDAIWSEKTPAAFTTTFGLSVPRLVVTDLITPSSVVIDWTIVSKTIFTPFCTAFSA
jgi:hypothetical protein